MPVGAQSPDVMTDAHIQRIKQNCSAATRTIQRIHVNDGLLRVNRVQLYDTISAKLMTPMNSRLIVNKLDASRLVKTTAQYDKTLTDFRESYKKYYDQMTALLSIDCKKQPVTFYDSVTEARKLRSSVHGNVVKLHTLINDYGSDFGEFKTQFDQGRVKGEE